MINKAVILAGGRGTRMLPYTKACPKELMPLGDKPALHYVVKEAADAGVREIAIILSPEKESVIKYFTYDEALQKELKKAGKEYLLAELNELIARVKITFITQHKADGTGGALLLAEEFGEKQPLLVMNGDDIMFAQRPNVSEQVIATYIKYGKAVLGVTEVSEEEIRNCGSVRITERDGRDFKIDAVIEKPKKGEEYSSFATQGRYVVTEEVFNTLKKTPLCNGELRLTDALGTVAENGGAYACAYEGRRYDTGSRVGYLEAEIDLALKDEKIKNEIKKLLKKYGG